MKIAITVIAIVLIVGGALGYIIYAKKSGRKCIGCPDSKSCSHNCGSCGCGCHTQNSDESKTQKK